MSDLAAILSNERLRLTLAVRDWLVGEARDIVDPNVIIEGLSLKLRDAGVPIDQAISAIEFRHAERAANARIWEFGSPAREHIFGHDRGSEATGKRPLAEAHRLKEWIFSWLPDLPDDTYDIVPELKAAGYTHHIAVPVMLPNGMRNGFTFAARAPNGFLDEDIAVLRSIVPTLAALQEILALRRVMREVMRMYVIPSRICAFSPATSGAAKCCAFVLRSCSPICAISPASRRICRKRRRPLWSTTTMIVSCRRSTSAAARC